MQSADTRSIKVEMHPELRRCQRLCLCLDTALAAPVPMTLMCSGSSAQRKSRFHKPVGRQSPLSPLWCLKFHFTPPSVLPLVTFCLLALYLPISVGFCLFLTHPQSSCPFLSPSCSKGTLGTLCCHLQLLCSHPLVPGTSFYLYYLYFVPPSQVSPPDHLSSRCLQAIFLGALLWLV